MNALIVILVLFLLSLTAAVILFRFLKSHAEVKTPQYQAGGAIAGFIIVFGLLHMSFDKVAGFETTIKDLRIENTHLQTRIKSYETFTSAHDISGSVEPYSDATKIALVLTEADLPINKKFRLTAPCIDLAKTRTALYVLQNGRYYLFEIFPDYDLSALKIDLTQ